MNNNNTTGRSALSDRTNSAGGAKDRRALLAEWKSKAKSRGGSENGAGPARSSLLGGVRRTGLGGGVTRVSGGAAAGSKVRRGGGGDDEKRSTSAHHPV